MHVIIDVTQDDLNNGVPGNSNHCAIARSLARQFPEWDDQIEVNGDEITLDGHYLIPNSDIVDFINAFDIEDLRVTLTPVKFEVEFEEKTEICNFCGDELPVDEMTNELCPHCYNMNVCNSCGDRVEDDELNEDGYCQYCEPEEEEEEEEDERSN